MYLLTPQIQTYYKTNLFTSVIKWILTYTAFENNVMLILNAKHIFHSCLVTTHQR